MFPAIKNDQFLTRRARMAAGKRDYRSSMCKNRAVFSRPERYGYGSLTVGITDRANPIRFIANGIHCADAKIHGGSFCHRVNRGPVRIRCKGNRFAASLCGSLVDRIPAHATGHSRVGIHRFGPGEIRDICIPGTGCHKLTRFRGSGVIILKKEIGWNSDCRSVCGNGQYTEVIDSAGNG